MEHKLKVRNWSIIMTSQEKKVPDAYHKLSYYNEEKAGEKEKRCLKCKRNISANILPVTSESRLSAISYQWEGSKAPTKNMQYYSGIQDYKTTDNSQGFLLGNPTDLLL